jgi:hypothetical protein
MLMEPSAAVVRTARPFGREPWPAERVADAVEEVGAGAREDEERAIRGADRDAALQVPRRFVEPIARSCRRRPSRPAGRRRGRRLVVQSAEASMVVLSENVMAHLRLRQLARARDDHMPRLSRDRRLTITIVRRYRCSTSSMREDGRR